MPLWLWLFFYFTLPTSLCNRSWHPWVFSFFLFCGFFSHAGTAIEGTILDASVVLFVLGAEARRCCQYTATLRSYQRGGWLVMDSWIEVAGGLIKFLLGQKWSMEEVKRGAIFGKQGVLTSPI